MKRMNVVVCSAGTLLLACLAYSLVNPSLQPLDLFQRYRAIVALRVTEVSEDGTLAVLRVERVQRGEFKPQQVSLTVKPARANDADGEDETLVLEPGRLIVAFVGSMMRGRDMEILMYVGRREWHEAVISDRAHPGHWAWTKPCDEIMVGTWNGMTERLVEMIDEQVRGTAFFPALVFARFKPDTVIADLGGPIGGVALYDLDGDGRLDVIACGPAGVRVFMQIDSMRFEDRTAALGLGDAMCRTLSIADVNGNGRPDLLLGATIYLNEGGRYVASSLLPQDADRALKVATFVDLNHDGYPDVLVSRVAGGLQAYLNPLGGPAGVSGPFTDATESLGLDQAPVNGDGYIAWGDWNLDGRTDLFYGVDDGLLLVQNKQGRFEPVPHQVGFHFKGGPRFEVGLTGAGMFAPIWRQDRMDLIVPADMGFTLATNKAGVPTAVTGHGNELALASINQVATLAEDLDMDGYVDLFTITRDVDSHNIYHTNRGYGSFMKPELYHADFMPAEAYETGAGGVAAGDIDGDGANDLLLGGLNGKLTVILSDCLSLRQPQENPRYHEGKLQQTSIISVTVQGRRGVLGARVEVRDATGRLLMHRQIGNQVLTGCRGPDTVNLAIREPGDYLLTVIYSDGQSRMQPLTVKAAERQTVTVQR